MKKIDANRRGKGKKARAGRGRGAFLRKIKKEKEEIGRLDSEVGTVGGRKTETPDAESDNGFGSGEREKRTACYKTLHLVQK